MVVFSVLVFLPIATISLSLLVVVAIKGPTPLLFSRSLVSAVRQSLYVWVENVSLEERVADLLDGIKFKLLDEKVTRLEGIRKRIDTSVKIPMIVPNGLSRFPAPGFSVVAS